MRCCCRPQSRPSRPLYFSFVIPVLCTIPQPRLGTMSLSHAMYPDGPVRTEGHCSRVISLKADLERRLQILLGASCRPGVVNEDLDLREAKSGSVPLLSSLLARQKSTSKSQYWPSRVSHRSSHLVDHLYTGRQHPQ